MEFEFEFDLENPFSTCLHNFPLLFQIENDQYIPSISYLQTAKSNPSTRTRIVAFIRRFCRNFDVFSSYLAINYMDRFLSAASLTILQEEKAWILRAIAVSCVSLALKMRKMDFSVSDFQVEDDVGLILDPVTIERTEMLILGALKWRMRSVNPFSFISFFIPFLGIEDRTSLQALKDRAADFILRAQNDVKLLEFKPSVISGAALLSAANEESPSQLPHFSNSISGCEYVSKVELFNCYDVMQQDSRTRDSSLSTSSSTSNNMTDSKCYISSTSQTKAMNEINMNVDSEIRVLKRRKIGDFTLLSGT